jgi:hypothetical protein
LAAKAVIELRSASDEYQSRVAKSEHSAIAQTSSQLPLEFLATTPEHIARTRHDGR